MLDEGPYSNYRMTVRLALANSPGVFARVATMLAKEGANLGAVETIIGPPATTSHVECTLEERRAMGIPESLIRYSTGIENVDDLIADHGG